MLRSSAASSSWQSPVIAVSLKQASEITRLRLMFLTTLLSCFRRFLPALQQNRAQSRLLYLLNRKRSINYNLVSLNFFSLWLECQCVQMKQIAFRSVCVNYKYSTHQPFILKFISEFILLSQLIYVIVQTMRAVLSQCC